MTASKRKRPRPPTKRKAPTKAERLRRDRLVEEGLTLGMPRLQLRDWLASEHDLDIPERTLDDSIARIRDRWQDEAQEAAATRREQLTRLVRREANTMLEALHAGGGRPPTWAQWLRAVELMAKVEGLLPRCPIDDASADDDDQLDLSVLTDEELLALQQIQRKVDARQ